MEKNHIVRLFALILFTCITNQAYAAKHTLPIPRFVSIKPSEANIRTGPNVRYPVKWVFVKKGEPVEVVAEFEQWRKIRDKYGDEGWIHESMLSGKRYVIIAGNHLKLLREGPEPNASPIAKIEAETRLELLACKKEWCKVQVAEIKGWIEKKNIWGVYNSEILEK